MVHMTSLKRFVTNIGNPAQCIFLTVVLTIGIFLRCWQWSSQLLLDDEWHALNFVLSRSFTDVLLQQGMGANSIPINIWTWLLLHTVGWSEALLKLPSLVCGIVSLVVFPWLVNRLWGGSVATVATALLAVSPVVIFYSRLTRPYAPTMLLATVSLLLTIKWMQDGQRRDMVTSAVSGSLAISFHLYAAIPVCAPLLVAACYCLKRRAAASESLTQTNALKFTDLLIAFGIFTLFDGLMVVLPNLLNPWWKGENVQGVDHATVETARTVMTLLAGSRSLLLGIVAAILVVAGLSLLIRNRRSTGIAFSVPFLIFFCVAATTTQEGSHAGIQVARYGISFFPLAFIAIAVTVVQCGEIIRLRMGPALAGNVLPLAGVAVWMPFLVTNPLWQIYTSPNNFTNHSGYQYRYEPIQWESASPERDLVPGFSLPYAAIPPFYFNMPMLSAAQGVIESPLLVGDQLNVYYYYQHFHMLPVVAGFNSTIQIQENASNREFVFAESSIEYILSSVPVELSNRSKWRTMVDLQDVELLKKRYAGWLLAVHLNPEREIRRDGAPDLPLATMTSDDMRRNFGDPVYLDGNMLVWKIQ